MSLACEIPDSVLFSPLHFFPFVLLLPLPFALSFRGVFNAFSSVHFFALFDRKKRIRSHSEDVWSYQRALLKAQRQPLALHIYSTHETLLFTCHSLLRLLPPLPYAAVPRAETSARIILRERISHFGCRSRHAKTHRTSFEPATGNECENMPTEGECSPNRSEKIRLKRFKRSKIGRFCAPCPLAASDTNGEIYVYDQICKIMSTNKKAFSESPIWWQWIVGAKIVSARRSMKNRFWYEGENYIFISTFRQADALGPPARLISRYRFIYTLFLIFSHSICHHKFHPPRRLPLHDDGVAIDASLPRHHPSAEMAEMAVEGDRDNNYV